MALTARQACVRLEQVGLSRRHARRVIAAGLAGRVEHAGWAHFLDDHLVDALCARPVLDEAALDEACPAGVFVARREVPVVAARDDQLASLSSDWPLSALTSVWLDARIRTYGHVPFVASIAGFVVLGADLIGVRRHGRTAQLELTDPSAWFDSVENARIHAGQGRPWVIRGWQPFAHRGPRPDRQLAPRPWSGSG